MKSKVNAEKILEIVKEKLESIESRLDNLVNGFKAIKRCLKECKELFQQPPLSF